MEGLFEAGLQKKQGGKSDLCIAPLFTLLFFVVGGSHVLYGLREQDVLGEGKKKIRM